MLNDLTKTVLDTPLPSDKDLANVLLNIQAAQDGSSPALIRSSAADGIASAQVNAGSLTSFTERLSGQSKSDVKNSTLFAQLASDYAYDRYSQPMDWYKNYVNILGQIGWNQPAFAFDTYTSGGSTVKLDEAVLNILSAIATGAEVAMVAATMQGLNELGDDSKQMTIWDANGSNGNNGNFQIMPVDKLPNDDVVMVLTGMQFNASTSHGRFLWWTWSSTSIKIQRGANRFVLNEDVYAQVRQAVIDKLGDRASQLVADIPIG
ncbi:hypothetical protein [Leisingera methylohalidivorans]|uniref:Uncharacterized protein n=1 Tax=Leisingera methylohalidivorans DSM 14336 TaxID=999552 RepID=V9VWQ8_9RHOB|nr:hypothetical protein [Leisingera methylohalidivorans]AHD02164.1 hypothetical protein METH_17275 [Leisingera methylohalidivorans DSM 14336]